MPRIPDKLLRSVVFVYPDAENARAGRSAGGSGFFVRFNAHGENAATCYLVTNTHVALGAPRTLRYLDATGSVQFCDIPGNAWRTHPEGDDISVAQIPSDTGVDIVAIDWSEMAASRTRMKELNVGVGDEVFMLGRFLTSDAVEVSQPLARFGNIAMMPGQQVTDGRGLQVEAFLMEMRSLPGYSGSPVFVYIGPGTYRGNGAMMPFHSEIIGLLGIDTGHKAARAPVYDSVTCNETKLKVTINSGVSIVAPAWRIADALGEMLA